MVDLSGSCDACDKIIGLRGRTKKNVNKKIKKKRRKGLF